jgi:hypothetical protein
MPGKICILGNGKGSVLTTLDEVVNAHGKPGKCVNLRHSFMSDTKLTTFGDRLISSLTSLASDVNSQVILVNFLGTIPQVDQFPKIITKFLHLDRIEITSQMSSSNGNKNQQPLNLGAEISMNSVTKYLSGHSDVIIGSLSMRDPALYSRLLEARTSHGSIPGPFEAWLALRGVRTFPLRFRAAEANARALVERLETLDKVSHVRYPGFGAIISFELDASVQSIEQVLDSSRLITNATSLGGVETTWERRRRWPSESESISENLVRLSVGCEHIEDLWSDISASVAGIND